MLRWLYYSLILTIVAPLLSLDTGTKASNGHFYFRCAWPYSPCSPHSSYFSLVKNSIILLCSLLI